MLVQDYEEKGKEDGPEAPLESAKDFQASVAQRDCSRGD
jgi:hypothetical protein